jgi:hypothetical protein
MIILIIFLEVEFNGENNNLHNFQNGNLNRINNINKN